MSQTWKLRSDSCFCFQQFPVVQCGDTKLILPLRSPTTSFANKELRQFTQKVRQKVCWYKNDLIALGNEVSA